MKSCNWYLLLNGRKIYNIRQLRENFDTQFIKGYFLGGSLIKWLRDIGEDDIADRISSADMNDDIGKQLEFAFGVVPDIKSSPTSLKEIESIVNSYPVNEKGNAAPSDSVIKGSFKSAAVRTGMLPAGPFEALLAASDISRGISSYNSAITGQALNSSFNAVISGSGLGRHTLNGFYGSFSGSSGSYSGKIISSLNSGSGKTGSFGSFGGYGNIWMFSGEGSFRYSENGVSITAEEYQRTLINLSSCPLNAYGYGINLI